MPKSGKNICRYIFRLSAYLPRKRFQTELEERNSRCIKTGSSGRTFLCGTTWSLLSISHTYSCSTPVPFAVARTCKSHFTPVYVHVIFNDFMYIFSPKKVKMETNVVKFCAHFTLLVALLLYGLLVNSNTHGCCIYFFIIQHKKEQNSNKKLFPCPVSRKFPYIHIYI